MFGVMSGAGHIKRHHQLRMIHIMEMIPTIVTSIVSFVASTAHLDARYGDWELQISQDYI